GAIDAVAGRLKRVFDAVEVLDERLAEHAHGAEPQQAVNEDDRGSQSGDIHGSRQQELGSQAYCKASNGAKYHVPSSPGGLTIAASVFRPPRPRDEPAMQIATAQAGKTRVGFIGTGVMGQSMCRHIMNAGYAMTVSTRTKSKAQPLLDAGAT